MKQYELTTTDEIFAEKISTENYFRSHFCRMYSSECFRGPICQSIPYKDSAAVDPGGIKMTITSELGHFRRTSPRVGRLERRVSKISDINLRDVPRKLIPEATFTSTSLRRLVNRKVLVAPL